MKHFSPLWSLIPGAALIAGCGSQPKDKTSEHSPQKPNVVYLIADDLGIGDLSCYGATKVSTPNIDRLAGQGMQFTNAYATSSTSTPSRYSMLTGEYAWRKEGTDVAAAFEGTVTDVYNDVRLGNVVEMSLGNGYEASYGQLENVDVAVGDTISQGEVIGEVSQPTRYYSVEGSHLNFMLTQDGNPVDPLDYLD